MVYINRGVGDIEDETVQLRMCMPSEVYFGKMVVVERHNSSIVSAVFLCTPLESVDLLEILIVHNGDVALAEFNLLHESPALIAAILGSSCTRKWS